MKLVIKRSTIKKIGKVCEVITNVCVLVGFWYIVCAAGTSDYYSATRQYCPNSLIVNQIIRGLLFMLPRFILFLIRGE